MSNTIEKLEASVQLDRALDALREGLALTQNPVLADTGGAETIAPALAKCIQNIFNLKSVGLTDPAAPTHIKAAMDHLRKTLSLLQNTKLQSNVAEKITQSVARCLALLFPVSSLIDQLKTAPRRTGSLSAPKVDGAPARKPVSKRRKSTVPPLSMTGPERRSAIRQVMEVDIGVHSGTNFFTGFSQDISSGGLFISTYDTLPLGAKVNVNFSLPSGPLFSVDGTVRWLRELNELTPEVVPGMGIQFDTLTDDEEDAINAYIMDTTPMFYE